MIRIQEIEKAFKELFEEEEGLVKSIDTVYEKPKRRDDFLKLVISIHGLSTKDLFIIHTKFIFKVDVNKRHLVDNSFIYLYDINCVYHKINFENVTDMKKKIEDIIESNDFGEDIQILSDFIESPAMFLNYYMRRAGITDYSIFEVIYEPKFKTVPCDKIKFDFKINVNNKYFLDLTISKIERYDKGEPSIYKFQFKFMDEIKTYETDTLRNVHFFIGDHLAKILDEKLKK